MAVFQYGTKVMGSLVSFFPFLIFFAYCHVVIGRPSVIWSLNAVFLSNVCLKALILGFLWVSPI